MNAYASIASLAVVAGFLSAGAALAQSTGVVDLGDKAFTVDDVVNALARPKTRGITLGQPAAAAAPAAGETTAAASAATGTAPAEAAPRRLSLQLQFAINSAELTPEGRKRLDVLGRALASPDLAATNLLLSGHTDVTGSYDYNLLLSKRRADSVKSYLVAAHDIAPARLKAVGRGPDELLDPDNPKSPANRRVQLAVAE